MRELDPTPPPPGLPSLSLALGLTTVAVFGAVVLVAGPVSSLVNVTAGLWFSELVIFFGLTFAALRALGRPPGRLTGLDSTGVPAVALGFGLGLVNYAGWAIPLMALAQRLFPPELLREFDGSRLFAYQSTFERVWFIAAVGLAAPVCEEFFFRGVVQRAFLVRLRPPLAIVLSALVFSLFHFDPVGLLARFELGLLFGLLAWHSGSLWPGIAAHAANNGAATALFLLTHGADDIELGWPTLALLAMAGNLGLLLLARLARGRLLAPRPADDAAISPPVPLWRSALPFAMGGLILVAAVARLDPHAVLLRRYDAQHPLPRELATAPELEALRARARAGEVPLEDYYDARRLMTPAKTP